MKKKVNMYTIAAILTVFNRKAKTLSCLENLYNQKLSQNVRLEVYLTDDGSTDGTSEAIKQSFPQTHIILGNGSLFWNRGMHAAWQEAAKTTPDFYLWINDDTILKNDCINTLFQTSIQKDHAAIIIGSTSAKENEALLTYGGRTLKKLFPLIPPAPKSAIPCEVFNGNIVFIPKKVFESVGFNDSYYRHSFGDFDYGIKAQKKGFSSFIAPGVLGYCNRNNPIPIFQRKCYSIPERFRRLYSPLGFNPFEDFHFQRKFHNILYCILHFIKLHINVFFAKDHTAYE